MGIAILEAVKGKTLRFTVTVSGLGDIDAYTCTLTVKTAIGGTTKISTEATNVSGKVATFLVDASENNITAGNYVYSINVTDGTDDNNYDVDLNDVSTSPDPVGVYRVLPAV
jgi:hypothetical protein